MGASVRYLRIANGSLIMHDIGRALDEGKSKGQGRVGREGPGLSYRHCHYGNFFLKATVLYMYMCIQYMKMYMHTHVYHIHVHVQQFSIPLYTDYVHSIAYH